MKNVTKDKFLGGMLEIYQPKAGYRAGVDPVLLAAACPAKAGQSVLDLGAGVGTAALCLAKRTGANVTGVEIQPDYGALATKNAAENDLPVEVIIGDIVALPKVLRGQNFDHVIMNPPYFQSGDGIQSRMKGREISHRGELEPAQWISVATQRLKPKGILTLINKADRLQDILKAMDKRLGSIMVLPLAPRAGKPANRVLVRAKKSGRGALVLCPPRILHEGQTHSSDKSDYTPEFIGILRHGAALDF